MIMGYDKELNYSSLGGQTISFWVKAATTCLHVLTIILFCGKLSTKSRMAQIYSKQPSISPQTPIGNRRITRFDWLKII